MQLAVFAVKILPRRAIFFVSDALSAVAFGVFRAFRNRSIKNLTLSLEPKVPAPEIRRIARASLKNFFRSFTEIPIILSLSRSELRDLVSVQGCEHLDAALAKGRGVILLSAHLGNFFVLGTRLALSGYSIHVLVNQPRHGRFAELMDQYRLQVLQRTVHARPRREALQKLTQILRGNGIAIIIADEYRRSGSGVAVPFFGRTVLARRGPVTLALRTGAALVPAYVIRHPDNTLALIVEPEIALERSEGRKSGIAQSTLRITEWLETTVRRYPDQWNWMNINWQKTLAEAYFPKKHQFEELTH